MSSPPTDVLMLNGVAALVKDLAEFTPVRELFKAHITGWQKKNALIVVQRRQAEAQLAKFWWKEAKSADAVEYEHWPARTIFSPDRTKKKIVPIPPELNRKLKKYSDPRVFHYLRSLDSKQDFSPTESFILLAELHDAAYSKRQLGYAEDPAVDVAEATKILKDGISQVAVERLALLVEKSLSRIELQTDANARNGSKKTLQQIIQRSRKKLEDLVALSRQHFSRHSDQDTVHEELSKLRIDLIASDKELARRLVKQIQIESERQRQQKAKAGSRRCKRAAQKKRAAHRPPDTDAKDDAKIGDAWLTGRIGRDFHKYDDLARELGRDVEKVREALDRDRKRRPEVWHAKRRIPRRNKSVKRA